MSGDRPDRIAGVRALVHAARYLTILPLPGRRDAGLEALGRAAPWFPVVGLALGGALAVVERVGAHLFPTVLAVLITVTAWKLATGGLHLDGLADCLDGLSGIDAEHRLAIMRDSRIGAFGAIGIVLFLLLEIAALTELGPAVRWRVLLVAPAVGRAMPALLARVFPAARAEGHGARFCAGLGAAGAPVGLAVAAAVALVALGPAGLAALVIAGTASLLLGRFLSGRLGGITGDVLGASVEVSELVVLLVLSASPHGLAPGAS